MMAKELNGLENRNVNRRALGTENKKIVKKTWKGYSANEAL